MDTSIWKRFKNGDRQAFEILIRTHYRSLLNFGLRIEPDNKDLVKDCIHDMFTHLWERRAFLSETDSVKPYLLVSLRNQIYKSKRHVTRFVGLEQTADPAEISVEDIWIATETKTEITKQLHQAIGQLTSRQREVIYLRFFQELNNDEIAIVMSISKPAVANLIHLSLRNIKDLWPSLMLILSFLGQVDA